MSSSVMVMGGGGVAERFVFVPSELLGSRFALLISYPFYWNAILGPNNNKKLPPNLTWLSKNNAKMVFSESVPN